MTEQEREYKRDREYGEERFFCKTCRRWSSLDYEGRCAWCLAMPKGGDRSNKDNDMISLSEYYDKLVGHDWYYPMSDDFRVFQAGEKARTRLIDIAAENGDEYMELFDAFLHHYYSGEAWGTEKTPLPPRPEEDEE